MNQSNCMVGTVRHVQPQAINASLAGVICKIKKVRQVRHLLQGQSMESCI